MGKRTPMCAPPPAAEPQSLSEPPADPLVPSYVVDQSCRSVGCSDRRRDVAPRPPAGSFTSGSASRLAEGHHLTKECPIYGVKGEGITNFIVAIAATIA